MTPTTEALARHVAGTVLADWVRHHTRLEPWELARVLGEHADRFGRSDLDCGSDSPAVSATQAAVEDLVAELVRYCEPKVAPLTGQRERVDLLAARLVETEVARLEAVRDGHRARHNDLANLNRDAIGGAAVNDLRSLVTRWMLDRGKAAFEAKQATGPRGASDPGE